MSDGVKLGQLLCDADIITKRQLSKALQEQVKGRKGTIGEILVDMGVCSFDDITDALLNSSTDTKQHEDKHEEIHKEPIPSPPPPPVPDIPLTVSLFLVDASPPPPSPPGLPGVPVPGEYSPPPPPANH